MSGRATRASALARAIYRRLLDAHSSARAGYAAAMAETFDALLDQAAERGTWAVAALLIRESAGLLRTARPEPLPDTGPPSPRASVLETLTRDVRYAVRGLVRRPLFSAAVIATLALGIGANTAIFSVVDAVLLQRLPFPNPDRLVMVWEDASFVGFPRNTPSVGNYDDWTTRIPAIDAAAALDQRDFNLGGDDPEKIGGAGVTANLFSVMGVPPQLGRAWRPEEDTAGLHVAVISYGLWQRRFGGDPGIVNRAVFFNDTAYTVLGVMPARFQTLNPDIQMWVPANFTPEQLANRGDHYLWVIARLRQDATLADANAQLNALALRLQHDFPDTNRQTGMYAVRLLDDYVGDTRTVLIVLLAAVGCVLLVACANVANLLLTRATGRAREMAVRAALGAGRGRLVQQLMVESLVLALGGGALGVALAAASFGTLTHLVPAPLADLSHVGLDGRVLLATAAIAMLTSVLFGLAPAWRASRADLAVARGRHGGRGAVGGPSHIGRALVVGEIALAMLLLVGAGLLVESFRSIARVDLGFRPAGVLTASVQLPRRRYAQADSRVAFVSAVLERVRRVPGVESAGSTSAVPLTWKGGTSGFTPEGVARDTSLPYDAANRVVTPGYMETIGMTLRAGRFFAASDDGNGEPVAIINKRMARQYWPGVDPIGRRFKAGSEPHGAWRTIVGIVDDTCVMGIDQPAKAEMYFPLLQSSGNWMWPRDLVVRTAGDPLALAGAIRDAVRAVDRTQPVSNVRPLDAIVADELEGRRLQMTLMSGFAALSLVLAVIGVYGALSYAVTSRTSEIGLRLALGGDPSRIRALVVRQGLALAAAGLAIGLTAAFWAATLLERLLFHVSPRDPWAFGGQALVLAVACVLATYLPARRASRVDPAIALRAE